MKTILIIDDEPGIRNMLASILEDERYRTFKAADAPDAFKIIETETIDLIFLDVLLPKMGGLEALEQIRSTWSDIEVVMISGHANIDMAVKALKLGAFDFLEKPLSLDRVLTVCRNALVVGTLRSENRILKHFPTDEIIGESPEIRSIRETIRQVADSDARILITGENGTGKEIVARALHRGSSRSSRAFVAVNCAAIPEPLIESELFGHEKGAFTDAVSARRGRFEQASGGTLFLDEIGDMSLAAQAKVLRALQESRIEHLGGEKTIEVDARVIAATNKDIEQESAAGNFRQDLFFRLCVIPIHVPPLRERAEDIPLLLFHFLKEFHAEHLTFDDSALENLCAYHWPGNIRELRNCAERMSVLCRGNRVSEKEVDSFLQKNSANQPEVLVQNPESLFNLRYNEAKESFEKNYLQFFMEKNEGVVSKAAEAMGLYPSNLHAKLKKFGIKEGK